MRFAPFVVAVSGLLGVVLADLPNDILTALEQATECAACDALLVPIQALAHLGNDDFVSI